MKRVELWSLFFLLSFTLASCDVVGGIFKAGIWVGIILVVLIVAVIFWLLKRFRR